LYERRRAQVSLFTGIVVVGITISIIRLIVLRVVARCANPGHFRIDDPPSHPWFVLTYLLGLPNVKNCDGF